MFFFGAVAPKTYFFFSVISVLSVKIGFRLQALRLQ